MIILYSFGIHLGENCKVMLKPFILCFGTD